MKQIDLGDVGCTLIFNGILSALINFIGVQVALARGSTKITRTKSEL